MPFASFSEYFPEIGMSETRTIRVPENSGLPLPPDEYAFVEHYCDEPQCDCRRVMLRVLSRKRKRDEAVITWGWESPSFYEKWLHRKDPEVVAGLIGPVLNIGSPASEIAPGLLLLTSDVLFKNCIFTDRIKRHYAMFRQKVGGRRR